LQTNLVRIDPHTRHRTWLDIDSAWSSREADIHPGYRKAMIGRHVLFFWSGDEEGYDTSQRGSDRLFSLDVGMRSGEQR
jgi:hypothetical protein